jgi:hypothetical protein
MTKEKLQQKNTVNPKNGKRNTIKILLTALVVFFVFSNTTKAQDVSCSELVSYVKSKAYPTSQSCFGSSFLAKVERYEVDGNGVVVAWIKSNDYDFTGKPYIYCGISSYT